MRHVGKEVSETIVGAVQAAVGDRDAHERRDDRLRNGKDGDAIGRLEPVVVPLDDEPPVASDEEARDALHVGSVEGMDVDPLLLRGRAFPPGRLRNRFCGPPRAAARAAGRDQRDANGDRKAARHPATVGPSPT